MVVDDDFLPPPQAAAPSGSTSRSSTTAARRDPHQYLRSSGSHFVNRTGFVDSSGPPSRQ